MKGILLTNNGDIIDNSAAKEAVAEVTQGVVEETMNFQKYLNDHIWIKGSSCHCVFLYWKENHYMDSENCPEIF